MAFKIDIVDSLPEHIDPIAENMREHDVLEVRAMGAEPDEALKIGLARSTWCKTGLIDDVPVVMFGVSPVSILSGLGAPWLLGTDDVLRAKKTFIKKNREYVPKMLASHPRLMNFVDVRNARSIAWLKLLGFEILPAVPAGIHGEMFHPFRMRAG